MKIGFVIYTKKQQASFIRSEIINSLKEVGELRFIDMNASLGGLLGSEFRIEKLASIPKILKKLSVFQQSVNLWKYKDRTMSHSVRALNTFGNLRQRTEWYSVIEYENANWGNLRKIIVKLFSHAPFHKFLSICIKICRILQLRHTFQYSLKQFDVILIPFGGHISAEFGNLVWLCKKLKIPVIALQENWDNLSSKTFIVDEPEHFAVWGRQSASHLRSIHRLRTCSITVVGSPRFTAYFDEDIRRPVASDPQRGDVELERPFILVAGTGDGLDDEMLLESVLAAVGNHPRGSSIDVVYRPHPFTRRSNSITRLQKAYTNLILDSDINSKATDHQIPLVESAQVVINHFSTMTLEALVAKNLVIVPLYLGRSANYRYNRFLDEAQHYIGAGLIPNLFTPSSKPELEELIKSLLSRELDETFRADVSWMCSNLQYGESLGNLVRKVAG